MNKRALVGVMDGVNNRSQLALLLPPLLTCLALCAVSAACGAPHSEAQVRRRLRYGGEGVRAPADLLTWNGSFAAEDMELFKEVRHHLDARRAAVAACMESSSTSSFLLRVDIERGGIARVFADGSATGKLARCAQHALTPYHLRPVATPRSYTVSASLELIGGG
jgi:hypothetical protein